MKHKGVINKCRFGTSDIKYDLGVLNRNSMIGRSEGVGTSKAKEIFKGLLKTPGKMTDKRNVDVQRRVKEEVEAALLVSPLGLGADEYAIIESLMCKILYGSAAPMDEHAVFTALLNQPFWDRVKCFPYWERTDAFKSEPHSTHRFLGAAVHRILFCSPQIQVVASSSETMFYLTDAAAASISEEPVERDVHDMNDGPELSTSAQEESPIKDPWFSFMDKISDVSQGQSKHQSNACRKLDMSIGRNAPSFSVISKDSKPKLDPEPDILAYSAQHPTDDVVEVVIQPHAYVHDDVEKETDRSVLHASASNSPTPYPWVVSPDSRYIICSRDFMGRRNLAGDFAEPAGKVKSSQEDRHLCRYLGRGPDSDKQESSETEAPAKHEHLSDETEHINFADTESTGMTKVYFSDEADFSTFFD